MLTHHTARIEGLPARSAFEEGKAPSSSFFILIHTLLHLGLLLELDFNTRACTAPGLGCPCDSLTNLATPSGPSS